VSYEIIQIADLEPRAIGNADSAADYVRQVEHRVDDQMSANLIGHEPS